MLTSKSEQIESLNLSNPQVLLLTPKELRQSVQTIGQEILDEWRSHIQQPDFLSSSLNLALRQQDLREIQTALVPWGLCSLGRIDGRVMPNLDAIIAIDDGKIRTRIVDCQYPVAENLSGILLEVTNVSPKGVKLRPEKGINFPKTVLSLSPLTEKDLQDLDKVRAILSLSTTFNRESKYATVDAKKVGKKAEIIKAIAYLNNMRSLQLQTRSGNNRGLIHSC